MAGIDDLGGEMFSNNRFDQHSAQEQVLPFTPAAFRRAWADDSLTIPDICARFGLTRRQIGFRVKGLNLPPKKGGRKSKVDEAMFRALWAAGISAKEIGLLLGVCPSACVHISRRLDLPRRGTGWAPRMTLAAYRETLLAKAMAETARIEQRQIKLAEMWDQPGHSTSGKRKAA